MSDELEEFQYQDHADLSFVYDEEPEAEKKPDEGKLTVEAKKKTYSLMYVFTAVVVLMVLLCIVIWNISGREGAAENRTSSAQTESTAGGELADEADYPAMLEEHMNELHQGLDIRYVTENGRYMPWQGLIVELGKDESAPEGVVLVWDDAEQCYKLITYFWDGINSSDLFINTNEYVFDKKQVRQGQIDTITVNTNTGDGCMDVILAKHSDNGQNYSIFMRYQKDGWICMGELEGIVEQQSVSEAGKTKLVYDAEGRYLLRAFDSLLETEVCQYWTVQDDAMRSDYQISYNQTYWDLADAPEWYMKRPVLAYAAEGLTLDETKLQLLHGTTLKLTGLLMWNDTGYYRVETETGETGYILLNHIEGGTFCQVQLQSLPFEEVFSERSPADSDISEDAFTPLLPIINAPLEQAVASGERYEAWLDLNGDGVYEKIYAKATWQPDREGLNVRISMNDCIIVNKNVPEQDVRILILDFDTEDQWLEFGYYLNGRTELYRYDGNAVRSLGLSEALCFGGAPELEQLVQNDFYETNRLTVRGTWGEYDYWYEISAEKKTGCFYNAHITECSFDTAVACKTWGAAALYAAPDGEEEVLLDAGASLKLLGICAQFEDDQTGRYYGYFQLEDGTYGYSEAFAAYNDLRRDFDLTDLFGPLAG